MAVTDRPATEQSESMEARWQRAEAELRALGASVAKVTEEIGELGRKEAVLARTELGENLALIRSGSMYGVAAGVFALLMLGFLSLAAMFGLAEVMPLWAAALVVTGVLGVIVGVTAMLARSRFRELQIMPVHTMRSLREDVRWAREQLKRSSR